MMTVKDLKEMLSQYPDDLLIIHGMYSDYMHIDLGDWEVVKAVDQGNYVMRSHRTMSEENKEKEATYLALAGN